MKFLYIFCNVPSYQLFF